MDMNENNLLQRSIYEHCKLALPSGLTELMSDISREVLRAQPDNLCQFITNYLAAMLVTRDNIFIAANVCSKSYTGPCYKELDEELREIYIDEEDIEKAKEVIFEYFNGGTVNETNLMMELLRKTNINEETLPAVQKAVRSAFKRRQAQQADLLKISENDIDDISRAVKHTLELYKKTKPSKETYHKMAQRIQASYRAYGVSRKSSNKFYEPTKQIKEAKRIILDVEEDNQDLFPVNLKTCLRTVSSATLAGSLRNLPKYRPCPPHESILEENSESVHINTDYTSYGNNKKEYLEVDDQSESSETVIQLHHVINEYNYIEKTNIKKRFESHDQESAEVNEIDIQEEPCQAHDDDQISEESIDEDIHDDDTTADDKVGDSFNEVSGEVEEIIDYTSNPED